MEPVSGAELDWTAIYAAWQPKIVGYLRHLLAVSQDRRTDLAEDLTADTFLRAFEHRASYQPRAGVPFTAWLYRIAHNRLLDYVDHRETGRRHGWTDYPPNTVPAAPDEAAAREFARAETRATVESLLAAAGLNVTDLAVLRLRFGDGLDTHETAAALGVGLEAAKQRQQRALRKLRRAANPRASVSATPAPPATCARGHPWNPATSYCAPNGRRFCRLCAREYALTFRNLRRMPPAP